MPNRHGAHCSTSTSNPNLIFMSTQEIGELSSISESSRISAEELANVITHALGAIGAVFATFFLVLYASVNAPEECLVAATTGFAVFGASMFILYTISAIYHSIRSEKLKATFKVLDHCAIYLLISGSYTAFALTLLPNWIGWTIFGVNWALALTGIFIYAGLGNHSKYISMTLYLLMGWLIIFALKPLLDAAPTTVIHFLVCGGVSYTAGCFFYLKKNCAWSHPVWHLFVLGGSIFHFFAAWYIY